MITTLLYFLLALLLLVIVHEYGHFQVARWFKVKVLRFSFGFGPILARFHDKKGTEYACSLIPLGGYVKMLDEAEGEVAADEAHLAFNRQSVWVRIAIVLAGPLFNFLFAFCALWFVLILGMYTVAPMIASVTPNGMASQAGLKGQEEIIAINGTKVSSWHEVQYLLMPLIGSNEVLQIQVKSLKDGSLKTLSLPLNHWQLDRKNPDPLYRLGIEPFMPKIPAVIAEVVPNSPAAKAGLLPQDKIISVDGQALGDWMYFAQYIRQRPDTTMRIEIERQGKRQYLVVYSGHVEKGGKQEGQLGVRSAKVDWPSNWLHLERKGPLEAIPLAFKQTIDLTKTSFILIGRLISGHLGLGSISGPIGIAQGAGDSARGGLVPYVFFLALVSISLGVINLLPIPLLDGGHLLYYIIELLRGKPLSEQAKTLGFYLGMILLLGLMSVALMNDLWRLNH
jgi:regulator of sigma E protease